MAETKKQKRKIKKVMQEYSRGDLHSGGKGGPVVKSPRQAKAIAMSEAGIPKPMSNKKLAQAVAKRIEAKGRKSSMY